MEERRHSPRLDKRVGIKFKLFDAVSKTHVTNAVDATTENLSKEGMCLLMPRGWDCPECNNCLGWTYNLWCKLKNGHTPDANHFPAPKLHLRISIPESIFSTLQPIELEGECAWIIQGSRSKQENFKAGISFVHSDKKQLSAYHSALTTH